MGRVKVSLLILMLVLLSACGSYSSVDAKKNGDIVAIGPSGLINQEKIIEFMHDVDKQQNSKLRITRFTIEGDPIISDLRYNGKTIIYTYDTSHDKYAGSSNGKSKTVCSTIEKQDKTENITQGIQYFLTGCEKLIGETEGNKIKLLFVPVKQISIEAGAEIKLSKKADLYNSGNGDSTIALVNYQEIALKDNSGYLGIWDQENKLTQRFEVKGYDITHPVQIAVMDITGDNHPDIVLENDAYANGGNGTHVIHVFVQEKGKYVETPVPSDVNTVFSVLFDSSSNEFLMESNQDKRKWNVKWTTELIKYLDKNELSQPQIVNVDPISAIDLQDNVLKTKQWLWFGKLQLNSLANLVNSYYYENGEWVLESYSLESIGKMSTVIELK